MRKYLYIWNNPEEQFLVASGIEFKDLFPTLESSGGLVLLNLEKACEDKDFAGFLRNIPRRPWRSRYPTAK